MKNNDQRIVRVTHHVKNMVCNCCIILLRERLEKAGIIIHKIKLGIVEFSYNADKISEKEIEKIVTDIGLEIVLDKEEQIVAKIKTAVIELVHQLNNVNSIVRKSEYLVEKLNMSYQQISKVFSKHEKTTLERYIILQKIEKIKELINSNEYTISEISYMMDYSSVQHLSSQFKKVTGTSVSEYKKLDVPNKKSIDEL